LYLCLPPIWGAAGGDFLDPLYSWDQNANQSKKTNRVHRTLKRRGALLQGDLYMKFLSGGWEL
jgi:hypothetical protein